MFRRAIWLCALLPVCASGLIWGCASSPSAYADQADLEGSTRRLLQSAERGSRPGVRSALREGAGIEVSGADGRTALIVAALNGHDELVQFLLASGANVNAQDRDGNTALHLAAMRAHEQTVRQLKAGGADLDLRNKAGKTALDVSDPDADELLRGQRPPP